MKKYSILFLSFILFVFLSVSLGFQVQWSSPLRQFNVTPDVIYLNWTNDYASNIKIAINDTWGNVTVEILNGTWTSSIGSVVANYSQSDQPTTYCQPIYYHLFVNGPWGYNNTAITDDHVNFTLIDADFEYDQCRCKPGRYWIEQLTIRNKNQINETANITVFIDIPISSNSDWFPNYNKTGINGFEGILTVNATTYHSYYINVTELADIWSADNWNVTSIGIKLTGWSASQDVDIFLFDEYGNLKAKSIYNTTGTLEWIRYNFLPDTTSGLWEIRVYGDDASTIDYNGYLVIVGLNSLDTATKQIISKIDLGVVNASDKYNRSITLRNEINISYPNMVRSKELYHVKRFSDSGSQNFTFLVPDSSIASKVKVSLNWTGGSNYSFNLYDQDNSIVASSMNKFVYANVTGAMQEEFNETANIPSNAGIWKLEVSDNNNFGDPFDVEVQIHVDTSSWIVSDYSTISLNESGVTGNSTDVIINFTIQNNTLDGLYEGYLEYLGDLGAGVKIPISINVTTPMLVVNNTLESMTARIDEDYGSTLTKTLNFVINNTGSNDLIVTLTNSSNKLTCFSGSCTGYFATFTHSSMSSISKHSSETLNVSITFNSSMPANTVYQGWIYIWGNNSETALNAHPYDNFKITLKLNLTNLLNVEVLDVNPTLVFNASAGENVTTRFKVYYINGTEIEAGNNMPTDNFTIKLRSVNVTDYYIPQTGGLTLYNATTPPYFDGKYNLYFSVPEDEPGDRYEVQVTANYARNPSFSGTGGNQSLIINNTGLHLTALTTASIEMDEYDVTYFNATVVNYGLLSPDGTLTMDSCTHANIVAYAVNDSDCIDGSPSGRSFTFDDSSSGKTISPNGAEACEFSWKITGLNVTGTKTCSDKKVSASDPNFGDLTLSIKVYDTEEEEEEDGGEEPPPVTPTTTGTTTTTSTTTTTTLNYLDITSYPSSVSIEQGKSKIESVKVKNINKTRTQAVTLSVLYLNSSWYRIPVSSALIRTEQTYTFKVNFTIPSDAKVDDYDAKFNASSRYIEVFKPFTLTVTPGAEMKKEIDESLSNYTDQLSELEREINETKMKGYNTSEADSLLEVLKAKIEDALDYRDADDYKAAYDLFDDIESLLNQTRTSIREVSAGDWWSWGRYVIIIAVGAGGAFLGYLFWPTPSYKEKGVAPKPKEEVKEKFTEKFQKLKDKWKELKEKKESGIKDES
jgi:hypothetical protein